LCTWESKHNGHRHELPAMQYSCFPTRTRRDPVG
jgi:hypothetical protein